MIPPSARWTDRLELVALFLIAPLGMLAPLGLAPLFVFWGLLSACSVTGSGAFASIWRDRWSLALAALAVWGALSIIWAVDVGHTAERAARLVVELALGLILVARARSTDTAQRARWLDAAALGLTVAAVLAWIEIATRGGLTATLMPKRGIAGTDRGVTVMIILLAPVLWRLWTSAQRWAPLGLGTAVALGALFLHSDAAKLALALLPVAALIGWSLGGRALRVLAVVLAVFIVTAPAIVALVDTPERLTALAPSLKPSATHRLVIWRWTLGPIAEKWATGWGLESARAIPSGHEKVPLPGTGEMVDSLPLHPHNAGLELWIDLGAPGAILGALILATSIRRAGRSTNRGVIATRLATIAALIVIGGLSYGLWQSWWVATLWFGGVLASVARSERDGA